MSDHTINQSNSDIIFSYTLEDAFKEVPIHRLPDLVPSHIAKTVPPLRQQDGLGKNAIAHVRLIGCIGGLMNWSWYITEFDGKDTMFGYVQGFESEWGYISLHELETLNKKYKLPIVVRDANFRPTKVSSLN